MPDSKIPYLSFQHITYGTHETPFDLQGLLYRGGAKTRRDLVTGHIDSGILGKPIMNRIPLVKKIHDGIAADINKGLRRATVANRIKYIRTFFAWCDENKLEITIESVESSFYYWVEHLLRLVHIKKVSTLDAVYRPATAISFVLSRALDIKSGLIKNTRLLPPDRKKYVLGTKEDKQNLAKIFEFGRLLLDISNSLSAENVYGKLPVEIKLHNGISLIEWSGLRRPENIKGLREGQDQYAKNKILRNREKREADSSHRTRHPLINLRIEVELLLFISQTGMNLGQAAKLQRGRFRYQSADGEVNVFRVYKNRRHGEAEFRIYKEYGEIFKRYLAWLDELFPSEESRLFPFIYPTLIPRADKLPFFQAIELRCKRAGIPCIKARALRSTRVNWLLRRSRNPTLTAEMSQHTQETLIRVYEKPHHQVAASEIARFHRLTDPAIAPPSPGACIKSNHKPRAIIDAPEQAPSPDCINPAGCLFCDFHRDIQSADYIWSLASYRYCKRLELDRYAPPSNEVKAPPAVTVINRVSEKLKFLQEHSEVLAGWVSEANDRIREGRYHPAFDGLIQLMELRS